MTTIEFLRQFKIGPFAAFDFLASYAGFYLLSPLIIKIFSFFNLNITRSNIMWLVLPISIISHIIVNNHTPMTRMFLTPNDYFSLKIIILFMIYKGLKGVFF